MTLVLKDLEQEIRHEENLMVYGFHYFIFPFQGVVGVIASMDNHFCGSWGSSGAYLDGDLASHSLPGYLGRTWKFHCCFG
jgi:hypothetical protein